MLAERVERWIHRYRDHRRLHAPGDLGAFYRAGGNEQLHAELPLGEQDLVLDVGGFEGDWTAEILVRYGSRSRIFEPLPASAQALQRRFGRNARVTVHAAALMGVAGTVRLSAAANSSSVVGASTGIEVPAMGLDEVLASIPGEIAVVKMNVEGAELELLERWIALDAIARVRTWLIQFHDFTPDAKSRAGAILASLERTHTARFRYPWVWERWDRR